MNKTIRVERRTGGITLVFLDNPPLNIITLAMTAAIKDAFSELEEDPSTRVVILSGSGEKAFCAGADIKEFSAVRDDVINKKLKKENEAFSEIENLSKPVIAAMDGLALGGGCEMALACDLRIMAEDAKIGLPEVRLGVFPGTGGIYRLPKIIGIPNALEMMYIGETITAKEAYRIGLINHIAPSGQALTLAIEIAGKIAGRPRQALAAIKKGVRKSLEVTREEAIRYNLELSDQVFKSADCEEGIRAFFEKRSPKFE